MYRQSGVIAFRTRSEGLIEVLLVTSRSGKRWVIPKGIVEEELTARQSAASEALEEAGVVGVLSAEPIGSFRYRKWKGVCHVEVFLMRVDELLDTWLESSFRTRRWLAPEVAAGMVREAELSALLAHAEEHVDRVDLPVGGDMGTHSGI